MQPHCILIVEDDRPIRDTMRLILEMNGYFVYTAKDGREALNILKSVRPSLVILDLMMPVMNGWQFLDELKLLEGSATIPVIIVSAAGNAVAAAQTLGKELLQKPINLDTFLRIVKRYCDFEQVQQESDVRKHG